MKIPTRCVRVFAEDDPHGAVAPPIYQTATFRQPSAVDFGEYDYSRTANPTRALVENGRSPRSKAGASAAPSRAAWPRSRP